MPKRKSGTMKQCGRIMFLLVFLSLGMAGNSSWAQDKKLLKQFSIDLIKVNRSIEVTRKKILEVKDVVFLPDLYFVLAELYVDKSRYLYTITREKNPKTPTEELDVSDSMKTKKQAIETYQRFIENFPKNASVDKAYFFMAHEYRELGNSEEMIKIYGKITSEFPLSKFWEEVQLILGNYFFDGKKDFATAQEFYRKILLRPANPFMPIARYKLGWCYINQHKFLDAMLSFEAVLLVDDKIPLEDLPDIYKQSDVKRDALFAIVWPYSEQEKLEANKANALKYFERLSPSRTALQQVLVRLAKRMLLKNKVDEAIPIYYRLMDITFDLETKISVIDAYYDAIKKSKKAWPYEGVVDTIATTIIKVRSSNVVSAKEKKRIERNWEIYMRDIATQIQRRAKNSKQNAAWTFSTETYEKYLAIFPKVKFSKIIQLNLAETYFRSGDFAQAGRSYELLLRSGVGKKAKSVFDSAVESYTLALKNQEGMDRVGVLQSREGFRYVGKTFIKRYPRDKASAMVMFNIARSYYDERDFKEAVSYFERFVAKYPSHTEVTTAGQLILDSFNQREDYSGLIAAGKKLIAAKGVQNQQFKTDVGELVRQAEFRNVQDKAGDPKSRDYAKKLLQFAAKYQGSSLGDQALYEAFTNLKSKKDPTAYGPGEQLLLKHGDSRYAKEVTLQMGQMAMQTADYRRAASYFETFYRRYPKDPASKEFLLNAANMREIMGDYKEAAENFRELGQWQKVAEQYVLAQDWPKVAQTLSAQPTGDSRARYWMGLALYRQGKAANALSYLGRSSRSPASSFEDQTMAAHGLYLVAGVELKAYQEIQLGQGGDEGAIVKAKSAKLAELTKKLEQVIAFGNGQWTIAALYDLGRAYAEFAQFISKATMPASLSEAQQAQYKKLIGIQSAQFRGKADKYFESCLTNADKFEVFTTFVSGCKSQGEVVIDEAAGQKIVVKSSATAPSEANAVRKKLFDRSRDTGLLADLAQVYLRSADYSMARLIYNRILEIEPDDLSAKAGIGLTLMFMNDYEAAAEAFKGVLRKSARQPVAFYGLASLYKQFEFKNRLNKFLRKAKSVSKPKGVQHPWMSGL